MEIVGIDEASDELKVFKKSYWPAADKEHYGDKELDFEKRSFVFVAREDGEIIGYAKFTLDLGVAFLDGLLVSDEKRRQGVASALLKEVEEKAKELGAHVMSFDTGKNWKARKFYEHHGYKVICELNNYYGGEDFVLLEKRV